MCSILRDAVAAGLPLQIDSVVQIRTGRLKPAYGEKTGIFKNPKSTPVQVRIQGCEGDERAWEGHAGLDNALMHYDSKHYPLWRERIPGRAHLFEAGAFGENIVSKNISEENICIGDVLRIGSDVVLQVSKPRQPCYKLNHRFELKDMSSRSQKLGWTGWYYRVLKEGLISSGDAIFLVERKHPQWTIADVQNKLYKDLKNQKAMEELSRLPELGEEIREIFFNRLTKKLFRDDRLRLQGGVDPAGKWISYRLISKSRETPRIYSFIFEAVDLSEKPTKVEPGSHVRVKIGADGKLVRAYSVVGGDSNQFELGISYDVEESRGGSKYLHETSKVGDILSFSEIKCDFPLERNADCHILIAGGIGITALLASARYLAEQKSDFHLYYAIRSTEEKAFGRLLEPLGNNVTICDGSMGQRLNALELLTGQGNGTHVYTCGPDRLTAAVLDAAKGSKFPQSNIHSEAFAATTSGDPFTVGLAGSGGELEVKEEETLLDVLRDAGFDIPSSCEVGNCGTCKIDVCSGRVEHRGTGLRQEEKEKSMLSCVSRGIGSIVLDL